MVKDDLQIPMTWIREHGIPVRIHAGRIVEFLDTVEEANTILIDKEDLETFAKEKEAK